MQKIEIFLQDARRMIGLRVRHAEANCTIIEVMDDQHEIILEADACIHEIQADAFGNARREMRTLYSIPILNQAGDDLHPDFTRLRKNTIHSTDKTRG